MRGASTEIIIKSLRILARDIQSDDGVANLALLEAADCLGKVVRERDEALFLLKSAQAALDAIHSEVGGWIKNKD
jgi:hypothetical protein